MAALPIASLATWDYVVSRAPSQKVDDKITLFLSAPGGSKDTTYPVYVLDTTRVAFACRPGTMNERNPSAIAPNTTLNTDVDVPVSCGDVLRTFDAELKEKVVASLAALRPGMPVTWHSIVHAARKGSGYDDTMTFRVTGWTDFVARVTGRPLTYNGNTRTVPGDVSWLPRMAKTQPLREKETAFYKYSSSDASTGNLTYRAQSGGGRLLTPDDMPAGTQVKIVFSVSHVLVTLKGTEANANAVLMAKEVYVQPKLAPRASSALLMPGVTIEEPEEEGASSAFYSSTVEEPAMGTSPEAKRARTH